MELIMELTASRRSSLPWKQIVSWWLVLAVLGALCIGSRSYAKGGSSKLSGENIVSPKAKKCERVAKNTAVTLSGDTGILVYAWKRESVNVLAVPDGAVYARDMEASDSLRPVEREEFAEEEDPKARPETAELPVIAEIEPAGGKLEVLEILLPQKETEQERESEDRLIPDTGKLPPAKESESGKEKMPIVEEEKEEDLLPGGADEEAADDSGGVEGEKDGAEDPGLREMSGFLVDEDGYITGVTEYVDLTDGILILAREEGCIGIREGALSEVAGYVEEIYLPPNIREIEPGAFEEFTSAVYIEAAEDNPCYYSENGILYPKE